MTRPQDEILEDIQNDKNNHAEIREQIYKHEDPENHIKNDNE